MLAHMSRAGLHPSQPPEQQRQLAITNLFSITICLVTLPWAAMFLYAGSQALGAAVLLVSALCACTLLLNHAGRFVAARLWLLGWSNLAIFGFAIALGQDSGIALLFTATTCAPLALFDPKDHRLSFLAGVVGPVSLGAAAQRFSATHEPLHPLSSEVLSYMFPAALATTVIVLLFIVSYYYYVYERNRATHERRHRVEQARLDTALRESEQRYALASEGANDGLWEWSALGSQVFYSERFKRMLGHEPDDIGTSLDEWLDRVHPDDRERVHREIRDQMIGRSERLVSEFRMRHRDGTYHWMLTRGLAIRDAAGRAVRMAGWMTDVTDRRLAHERLAESEALSRQLVAQAADALYFFDLDGHIRDVNQRAVLDIGYSRDELLTMTVYDLDPQLAPGELAKLAARIPPHAPLTLERVHRCKDGRTIAVELRVGWFDFRGERHLLASARDVTVRKEMEAQLMLADRMVSVGTLAAGVAHEINNPLTSLLLNLELIERQFTERERELPEAFRERGMRALGRARDGAERVGVIVRDLKTFSRGDAEVREAVDLRRVIQSTLNLAHPELRRRATVHTDMPSDLPAVRANEARLGQLFLNLLLNAIQSFEGEDPRKNTITFRVRSDGGSVIGEVIDNGRGIPEDVVARIFDPFFTTKPVGVGTGLGLYICRNIVETNDGTLTCESRPGVGTTFRVTLPTVRSLEGGASRFSAVTDTGAREPRSHGSIPPPGLARARVLVIDDDRSVTASLGAVLVDHDVETAVDAEDARERLHAHAFDLVLCDCEVFEHGGLLLEPLLRRAPGRWVLASGGDPLSAALKRAAALGARVVDKPVRSELLWSLLAERTGSSAPSLSAEESRYE